jgi:hypothetical protein
MLVATHAVYTREGMCLPLCRNCHDTEMRIVVDIMREQHVLWRGSMHVKTLVLCRTLCLLKRAEPTEDSENSIIAKLATRAPLWVIIRVCDYLKLF